MPAKIDCEANNVCVMRLSGLLKQAEFNALQDTIGVQIDAGAKPSLLVLLQDFEGWERGTDWNDFDFMLTHGGEIAQIAIVGEPRWEVAALAFAGAGVRKAPVKFFPPNEVAEARTWLQE